VRNPETASIIERLIACRDTLKVVEGQFAVNLQPERAVMADAANALDAYDKTMQRIAEAPSPTPPAGDGWEPIETALTGVEIIVYWPAFLLDDDDNLTSTPAPGGHGLVGVSRNDHGGWEPIEALNCYGSRFDDEFEHGDPTHWRPLPPPPVSKGEG
jgi:hypothetical protein